MNLKTFLFLLFFFRGGALIAACPTCIAKVQHNSPPFFVDEFYIPATQDLDDDLITTGTGS